MNRIIAFLRSAVSALSRFLRNAVSALGRFLRRLISIVLVTAGIVLALVVLSILYGPIVWAITLGIFISVAVFMLSTPLIIGMLVNGPEGNQKSRLHLFTYPEEGKVKIVMRGDTLIRMIMLYADHTFARVGDSKGPAYWEVVETPGSSENPLRGVSFFIYPYAWYVYKLTGAVWTGLWPFQHVREYMIEKTTMTRNESDGNENVLLSVKTDISDHLRVRQFLFPIRIPKADTKDKISVSVLGVLKARVVNPYLTAFNTDRWDQQLVNMATNAISNYTRTKNLSSVLTATAATVTGLNQAVVNVDHDTDQYGLDIEGFDLIDISPNLSDSEKEKLYAEALAKPVGKATIIDGKSRAEALRAINEANQAGGEHSIETMRAEAMVRAAEAAGKNGTVILGGLGSTQDPMQAAILAELKKINERSTTT
jgi:regulator of protease activity HflC (stomatin/prohibitin superfamily)